MCKNNITLKCYRKGYISIFLNNKLFYTQVFIKSNNCIISDGLYTYIYVLVVLQRYGLVDFF